MDPVRIHTPRKFGRGTTNPSTSKNDIEGIIELTFSIDDEQFGERRTIDLIPNGRNIPVTNENKKQYVE